MVITETWLTPNIADNEFINPNYTVYRKDRSTCPGPVKSRGGGVMVAVRKDIKSYRVKQWETDGEDVRIVMELQIDKSSERIAICGVYLPSPLNPEVLNSFLAKSSEVIGNVDNVLLIGDFNMSFIT